LVDFGDKGSFLAGVMSKNSSFFIDTPYFSIANVFFLIFQKNCLIEIRNLWGRDASRPHRYKKSPKTGIETRS
jgi:hypothetical protein